MLPNYLRKAQNANDWNAAVQMVVERNGEVYMFQQGIHEFMWPRTPMFPITAVICMHCNFIYSCYL